MSDRPKEIADYEESKTDLFDLYRRFRYGEVVSNDLMTRAAWIETQLRRSVLGSVAISLVTGSTSYLNLPILSPVWAVFGALATFLAAYSLIVGSSTKQFAWFGLAGKFRAAADEVELFSKYVKLRKIAEDELLETWGNFSKKLRDLLDDGGVEHQQRELKDRERLRSELNRTLRDEGKIS